MFVRPSEIHDHLHSHRAAILKSVKDFEMYLSVECDHCVILEGKGMSVNILLGG